MALENKQGKYVGGMMIAVLCNIYQYPHSKDVTSEILFTTESIERKDGNKLVFVAKMPDLSNRLVQVETTVHHAAKSFDRGETAELLPEALEKRHIDLRNCKSIIINEK